MNSVPQEHGAGNSAMANPSHELRTRLATILNAVEILRQGTTKGAIAEQTLDVLEGQVREVIEMLDEVLDVRVSGNEAPVSGAGPARGRLLRVLLLEDDREAAKSLSRLLRLWGHEVRVSHDGPSALETAAEHRPEVALLDINVPGAMDGWDVARRLRERFGRKMFLVALTGLAPERQPATPQSPFDLYLTKPADPKELRRLLAEAAPREPAPDQRVS